MLRAVLLAALLAAAAANVVRVADRDDLVADVADVADEDADRYRVPDGMLWGAGVSALQTEGAWDADGKAESVADHVIFKGNLPTYTVNHAIAADSYHRFKEDVAAAKQLKLKMYKFSISWARVLPEANALKPNPAGVQFYHNLIDEIIKAGMTPVVTMYHFDHPQILEDQFKGWQSREMVYKFAEYSKFIFDEYASKVPIFVTINEPNMYCAYFTAQFVAAGFRTEAEVDPYQCIHNNILAHQAAYQFYQQGVKAGKWNGKVGYSTLLMQTNPATSNPEDVYATDIFNQLHAGTSLAPVVYGDYPQSIKTLLGDKLPKFTDVEKRDLVDSTDFIGLNIYFSLSASYNRFMNSTSSGVMSMVLGQMTNDIPFIDVAMNVPGGGSPMAAFTTINPSTIRDALLWTWKSYQKPIVITENGYGDMMGMGLHDKTRAAYFSAYLRSLVTTVKDYGVQVLAYSAWSLLDSFEFSGGYSRPFGLVHIDYEGQTLDRAIKDSSSFWTQLAETNVVPYVENPADASTTAAPTKPPTKPPTNPPTTDRTTPKSGTTQAPVSTTQRNSAATATVTALPLALLAWLLLAR
ncbi:putative beta-glucosidase 6 [Thrips palmi]|uniref:Beta-glucosidase 6 n=1 Tax=Thrips palmi TaxID=161013 RepID=A0A6P8YE85_THRPL|nr:putative beta-glucosidase 6 [Thrips palmi]